MISSRSKSLPVLLLLAFMVVSCDTSTRRSAGSISFEANPVVAHRGAWRQDLLPENSLASLKRAIELKCTGSEFDVWMTSDDSLVVNHDPLYHDMEIETSNYSDLVLFELSNGERLPTLREYIRAGIDNNSSTRLVCEIKPSKVSSERGEMVAARVVELVKQEGADQMVEYISFDINILQVISRQDPYAVTGYLEGDLSPSQLKQAGIAMSDYHYSVFMEHPEWIAEAKANNIILNAWTVDRQEDIDWLLANDFDLITTNEPELLKERYNAAPSASGWEMTWSDEFNYSGYPDSTKWMYEAGGHGWGNNEKQYYMAGSLENSYVEDGILHIVALRKDTLGSAYTSAKLTTYTKYSLRYGKVEVMAKLPSGRGSWPAVWMLPESLRKGEEHWPLCGEIDIMEHVGKDPGVVHTTLHSELYNHTRGTQVTHFENIDDAFNTFHKYGIEWDDTSISFFIDDRPFFKSLKGEDGRVASNEGWPFDKPYFLILNLAIGGNWGGEIDDSIFPAEMQVDYVRIFRKENQ